MLNLYGPQSMGIIGLFTTIQALFVLLDLGLGPLVARKTALRRHGQELNYPYLVGLLGRYFLIIGALGLFSLIMLRDRITTSWINDSDKSIENLGSIFIIMSLIVFLRWVQTYAKSILFGLEKIMWISNLNILFMVLKYPFVLFIFQNDNVFSFGLRIFL
jgi:Na+-driven multidrug efflux pump